MPYKNGTSLELFCIGIKRKAFDHIGCFSLMNLMLTDTLLPNYGVKIDISGKKNFEE
jgi:hypothetical protein